jgi:hypothetical protein
MVAQDIMLILLVFLHLLKFLVILFSILRYPVSFKNDYGDQYLPEWFLVR